MAPKTALCSQEALIFLMKAPLGVRVETLAPDLSRNEIGFGVLRPEWPRPRMDSISSETRSISWTWLFDIVEFIFAAIVKIRTDNKD